MSKRNNQKILKEIVVSDLAVSAELNNDNGKEKRYSKVIVESEESSNNERDGNPRKKRKKSPELNIENESVDSEEAEDANAGEASGSDSELVLAENQMTCSKSKIQIENRYKRGKTGVVHSNPEESLDSDRVLLYERWTKVRLLCQY